MVMDIEAEVLVPGQIAQWEKVDTVIGGKPKRPTICVDQRFLSEISEDAVNSLLLQNMPPVIFKRTGTLCRLRANTPTQTTIEVVRQDMILGMMERSALYINAQDDPVFPPTKVARDILAMPDWPFPSLSVVVSTPVLRPDGTILIQPGYDEASGLFYTPAGSLVVSEIPENPSKKDAIQGAAFLLTEVLGDFPYVDQASRANALAALITPIVRPVIDGPTPLFLFDKPTPGTGATLLVELIANVVTGESARLKKQSSNDEEMRKQITSCLLTGSQIIVFDNVDTKIHAPSLSSALTCRFWDDRILGQSKQVSLPNLASWYATGNNIQLAGDIPRRCCLIRIDAKVAKPWERDTSQFLHPNIIGWAKDNRSEIVAKVLTIARAWFVAGKPAGSARPLGSFESWTEAIGGMLEYAGVTGFLENAPALMERDSGADEWSAFLSGWYEIFGSRPLFMKELLYELWKDKALAEVMPEEIAQGIRGAHTQGAGIRISRALSHKAGVIHSGLKLIRGKDGHRCQYTWAVEKQEMAGSQQVVSRE